MWPGISLALLALFTGVFLSVYRRQREMIVALRRAREKIQLEETRVFDFLHGLGAALTAASKPSDYTCSSSRARCAFSTPMAARSISPTVRATCCGRPS